MYERENGFVGVFILGGRDKQSAVSRARQWMQDNGIRSARLSITGMRPSDIEEVIWIEL